MSRSRYFLLFGGAAPRFALWTVDLVLVCSLRRQSTSWKMFEWWRPTVLLSFECQPSTMLFMECLHPKHATWRGEWYQTTRLFHSSQCAAADKGPLGALVSLWEKQMQASSLSLAETQEPPGRMCSNLLILCFSRYSTCRPSYCTLWDTAWVWWNKHPLCTAAGNWCRTGGMRPDSKLESIQLGFRSRSCSATLSFKRDICGKVN